MTVSRYKQAVKKQIEDKQAILNAIQKSGELSGKYTERIENILNTITSLSEDRDNQLQQAQLLVCSLRHIVVVVFVLSAEFCCVQVIGEFLPFGLFVSINVTVNNADLLISPETGGKHILCRHVTRPLSRARSSYRNN